MRAIRSRFCRRSQVAEQALTTSIKIDSTKTMRATLLMHLCVLIWGFTAILGKVITLHALPLVAWRMALTAICLFFMARAWRSLAGLTLRDVAHMGAAGVLIALHWLAFYGSVKLANASVGVMCIALAPVFSALLTPWMTADSFSWRNFWLALGVLPGMALVLGGVQVEYYLGIAVGALSALLVAAFGLVNKRLVDRFEILSLSFVQIGVGAVLMWLVLLATLALQSGHGGHSILAQIPLPSYADWPYLLFFAVVCTALPFALASKAMRHMSAFSAQFAVNLEPVYGIVFAAVLLKETRQLTPQFYVGACVILLAVFAQGLASVYWKPRAAPAG
jgi:drug/metabolite transporter (DMT)-like permease